MLRDHVRQALSGYQPNKIELGQLYPSGVLFLLHERRGEDHIVFQQRTQTVQHHKGEVSLPGGARDPEDVDLLATALRETQEEIGVPAGLIEIYGQLDDTVTRTGYLVRPYVGVTPSGLAIEFTAAEQEVSELFHVPLAHLLSEESHGWKAVDRDGELQTVPAYTWEENRIWGATARMLGQFLELLGAKAWGR
jgi:8-oxo-dGTP pyrophosphatase MutT (NUDIX family)